MLISYIGGGIAILVGFVLFIYNWKHPIENEIPTMAEAIRDSKLVWGLWHTGERAKLLFKYHTVKRALLVEPITVR